MPSILQPELRVYKDKVDIIAPWEKEGEGEQ